MADSTTPAIPTLGDLGDMVCQPQFRKDWEADQDAAISKYHLATAGIPPGILNALKAFRTAAELLALCNLGGAYRTAGADPLDGLRMV